MRTFRIFPSILNANFEKLPEEIERVAATADYIHLDVMDNIFVPNFTFDLERSKEIIGASSLPIDVHLMVANADDAGPLYARTKAESVTIHFEACYDVPRTLSAIRAEGKRVGLAIKPGTPIDAVQPFSSQLDMVLVMTVEPGFGGQKFMKDMMPKVQWLRHNYPLLDIEVDGGVGLNTINDCSEAGANMIVSGTALLMQQINDLLLPAFEKLLKVQFLVSLALLQDCLQQHLFHQE